MCIYWVKPRTHVDVGSLGTMIDWLGSPTNLRLRHTWVVYCPCHLTCSTYFTFLSCLINASLMLQHANAPLTNPISRHLHSSWFDYSTTNSGRPTIVSKVVMSIVAVAWHPMRDIILLRWGHIANLLRRGAEKDNTTLTGTKGADACPAKKMPYWPCWWWCTPPLQATAR